LIEIITEIKGKCQFKNCEKEASCLACGKYHPLLDFQASLVQPLPSDHCEEHASIIVDEHSPEYIEYCPNCGCRFGVN
jgi:hypothetical protein